MDRNSHDFQSIKLTDTQIDISLLCVTDLPTFVFESRNWALWTGQKNFWNFANSDFIESDRVLLGKESRLSSLDYQVHRDTQSCADILLRTG